MLVPSNELQFNADDEALLPLYENEWMRMLLIRNRHSDDNTIIDVELSLPSESLEVESCDSYDILEKAIFYLEFLKTLYSNGFTLQLVDRDWLWSASIHLTDEVEEDILRLLQTTL